MILTLFFAVQTEESFVSKPGLFVGLLKFSELPFAWFALKKLEEQATPRVGPWDRIIRETGAPGIYYSDYPELSGFDCPEWSHLSAADSIEFTKRLVPHLQRALSQPMAVAGTATSSPGSAP